MFYKNIKNQIKHINIISIFPCNERSFTKSKYEFLHETFHFFKKKKTIINRYQTDQINASLFKLFAGNGVEISTYLHFITSVNLKIHEKRVEPD